MSLFISGPFGVGKTSVAKMIAEKTPNAMLYDPEVIGSALRGVLGSVKKVNDSQYYALWRKLIVVVARVLRAASARTLVIPMTVWRRDYFDPILAGLHRIGLGLTCFRLTASESELTRRIFSDSEDTGAYGWRMSHAEVCLRVSRDPAFGAECQRTAYAHGGHRLSSLESIGTPTGWKRGTWSFKARETKSDRLGYPRSESSWRNAS